MIREYIEARQALASQKFFFDLQPIVRLPDGETFGYEALLRRKTGDTVQRAADFLEVFEAEALANQIQAQALQALDPYTVGERCFPLSINATPRQLCSSAFREQLLEFAARNDIKPSLIEIEVTERTLLSAIDGAAEAVGRLHRCGFRLCIDDFGVGFSSLLYLKLFHFDCIKIDRAFIVDIVENKRSQDIVEVICGLAARFGANVVAEGIETGAQREIVIACGVGFGQGYLFGKPRPPGVLWPGIPSTLGSVA